MSDYGVPPPQRGRGLPGDLGVSGGPGGLSARLDDVCRFAGVADTAADTLRGAGLGTAALVASPDLAWAAAVCPVEVGEVELALGRAAAGALSTGVEMEALARLVRASVEAYELTDARLAALAEQGYDAAGFALGALGVPLVTGGVALLGLTDPSLLAELGAAGYLGEDALLADLQETVYESPWLEESLTRMAPGLVQGAVFATAGPTGAVLLSGGEWPTTDFPSAVAGLVNLGNVFGAFEDTGTFHVEEVPGSARAVNLEGDAFLGSVFDEQGRLDDTPGQVQVITVRHPGGDPSYVVQVPGTQDWDPFRGDNPFDLTTDLVLEAMRDTRIETAVSEAMARAHIPPGSPVMLTGHSLGGIAAASLTTDEEFMERYDVRGVVTGGAPIGRFDVPGTVSVLSLEHTQDIVAKLDGKDNPDRASWVTVTRELPDRQGTGEGSPDLGAAHETDAYATTGRRIDASTSETVQQWREASSTFFSGASTAPGGGTTATAVRYRIIADPG